MELLFLVKRHRSSLSFLKGEDVSCLIMGQGGSEALMFLIDE